MYMKVTKDMFFDEFRSYDKHHDFTDAGIEALFEYIEVVEKRVASLLCWNLLQF